MTIEKSLVAAAVLLAVAGCGHDKGTEPGGSPSSDASPSAPGSVAAAVPSAAPTPDRMADEAAIQALLTDIYTRQDGTNTSVYPMLTRRFAAAWKDCYALQDKVNAKEGDEGATLGECLDDAGSFIPGQDSEPGVPKRMKVTIAWKSPDAAVATVKMRLFTSEKTETTVTVALVREDGQWRVDDLDNDQAGSDGTGFRAALEQAIPGLKRRLSGKT